jgi:nucleoid-associated protein YgaU
LWKISEAHYKDGKRYRRIVRANAGRIGDPDHILPCQRVYLP